jgi:hypothetical protein
MTAHPPPQIVLDHAVAAELADVLGTIVEFLAARPAARASLARFAYPHCEHPYFWTDDLLDYLHDTVTDLHHLTHTTSEEAS